MKHYIFLISFCSAAIAARYPRDTDWVLQVRDPLPHLNRRGIIRPQHAATNMNQKKTTPDRNSVKSESVNQPPEPKQSPRPKSPGKPSPQPSSNHPRISLEADGPAAMTMVRGSNPTDHRFYEDYSTHRLSGEHPEKVVGMARSNANPTNTNSQTLRGTAYGKGVSARVMLMPGVEGSGSIQTESPHGGRTVNLQSGDMKSLTASSDQPRGAKVTAKSTPPGLVSFHAANERNFGDPWF